MLKKSLFFALITIIPLWLTGQTGYWSAIISGEFDRIDLNNAALTPLGNTITQITAADMDENGNLYAISNNDNGFYQIDTVNGNATFIGSATPPSEHVWTGMAFDDDLQTMYAVCSKGGAFGESSLYTIDLSTGQTTLVGSQNTAKSISCIAIDGDGQLYGVDASSSSKLYLIDKNDGSVTYVANMYIPMAGMGHGMDWNSSDNTMYLATYNSIDMTNSLRTVNLNSGGTVEVGSLPEWTGMFIAINVLIADFSSDVTSLCSGNQVHFTDESTGASSWQWTFEGGTPSSSTLQNPIVLYNTPGDFDVTLEVSNGTNSNTTTKPDYIHVTGEPAACGIPEGDSLVCNEDMSYYTSTGSPDADDYVWELSPAEAGTVTSNYLEASVIWNSTFIGTAFLSLYGVNDCGSGTPSDSLVIEVDDCTSVGEIYDSFIVSVSPNPAGNLITVRSDAGISDVCIYNTVGKKMVDQNVSGNRIKLNISRLPAGIYMMKVKSNKGIKPVKFIKK